MDFPGQRAESRALLWGSVEVIRERERDVEKQEASLLAIESS